MSNTKNVFISHIHEDDDGLAKVKELVAKHGLTVRDGSINSDKPNNATNDDYIMRDIITPRIDWCSTMVVYVTPGTKNSEWVNREIEKAENLEKRIVGVWANGHAGCEIPDALPILPKSTQIASTEDVAVSFPPKKIGKTGQSVAEALEQSFGVNPVHSVTSTVISHREARPEMTGNGMKCPEMMGNDPNCLKSPQTTSKHTNTTTSETNQKCPKVSGISQRPFRLSPGKTFAGP